MQLLKDVSELADPALRFISAYTKNPDLEQLRKHVVKVKENLASQLHVYGCITRNLFLMPRIQWQADVYNKEAASWTTSYAANKPFKVADIGCCFGADTRQLILDGVHPEDIHSIDVHSGYWDFGLELYGDKETLKVNTLFTDVSEPNFSAEHNEITNKFNLVYTGAVIHVFAKDEAETFVRNIFNMLASGGTYFGNTGVAETPIQTDMPTPKKDKCRYIFSGDSLAELFKSIGFIEVNVATFARPSEGENSAVTKFALFSARKP